MSFDQAINQGWELFHAGQYELALKPAVEAAGINPQEPRAPYLRSLALTNLGRYEQAIEAAEQTLSLAPDWAWSHFARGFALVRQIQTAAFLNNGRVDPGEKPSPLISKAEHHLREAIRLDPQTSNYFDVLGELLHVARRDAQAEEVTLRALTLKPNDAWLYCHLARIQRALGKSDEAEQSCNKGLALAPNNSVLHWVLGWVRIESGRPKESLACFRESLRLWPHARFARSGLLEALKAEYAPYRWVQGIMIRLDALMDDPKRLGRIEWRFKIGVFFLTGLLGSLLLPFQNMALRLVAAWVIALIIVAFLGYSLLAGVVFYLVMRQAVNLILLFHPFGRLVLTKGERLRASLAAGFGLPLLGCLLSLVIGVFADLPEASVTWVSLAFISIWLIAPWLACWAATANSPRATLGRMLGLTSVLIWLVGAIFPVARGPFIQGPAPWAVIGVGLLSLYLLVRRI